MTLTKKQRKIWIFISGIATLALLFSTFAPFLTF